MNVHCLKGHRQNNKCATCAVNFEQRRVLDIVDEHSKCAKDHRSEKIRSSVESAFRALRRDIAQGRRI